MQIIIEDTYWRLLRRKYS